MTTLPSLVRANGSVSMAGLILASASPRRHKLLEAAGFSFTVSAPKIAERADTDLTPRELTSWNALRKGLAVGRHHSDTVVLAADTIVFLDGSMIGKPADFDHAVRILRQLSGKTHHVYSSVFVSHPAGAKATLFCEISRVRFRKLDDRQIREYLTTIDPLDKAGAYAAQGHGAQIIAEIDGSYSNVVGLPMEQTIAVLGQFGIRPN